MKSALFVCGGWKGHEPEKCAAVFAPILEEEGYEVEISTTLDTYLDKGQLLLEQKKYEQALRTFATGQKLSPGTADFYFWVAKTQQAVGNNKDAKMNFERAFALDKTMTEAKAAAESIGN